MESPQNLAGPPKRRSSISAADAGELSPPWKAEFPDSGALDARAELGGRESPDAEMLLRRVPDSAGAMVSGGSSISIFGTRACLGIEGVRTEISDRAASLDDGGRVETSEGVTEYVRLPGSERRPARGGRVEPPATAPRALSESLAS